MKATAVLGAHPSSDRYSNMATALLAHSGHPVWPLGIRQGRISGIEILTVWPAAIENLDTITLYMSAEKQKMYYSYLLGLKPRRVIFNPGAENAEYQNLLDTAGTEWMEACTLVMLRTGQY